MTQKITVTTIAMYIEGEWIIDTYLRMTPKKNFIDNFMKEYAGNGIEKIKIVDDWENEYQLYTMDDYKTMFDHIKECFKNINGTVLYY